MTDAEATPHLLSFIEAGFPSTMNKIQRQATPPPLTHAEATPLQLRPGDVKTTPLWLRLTDTEATPPPLTATEATPPQLRPSDVDTTPP